MNPIRPHRYVGIQLEQQIQHNFRVDCESILIPVIVLQLRALGPPWSAIHVKDIGKECLKHLCLVSLPVCEVAILIL